jgi:uncharacterized protein YpbB
VKEVCEATGRAQSTVVQYLCDHIRRSCPSTISTWVPEEVYQRVAKVTGEAGTERLRPIFLALGEKIPYDQIRLVVTHMNCASTGGSQASET